MGFQGPRLVRSATGDQSERWTNFFDDAQLFLPDVVVDKPQYTGAPCASSQQPSLFFKQVRVLVTLH